ncbi:hypothetical protein J31TS4_40770 [Paenibacillus sp. J31TS4]|uniref:GGDEF domain-containing protein n=1 Tax=Paenibacillus sp. J31TS4 TaxID=2807195 RepID=UPI001B27173B|nr:GGDEF domain-containing protein [Paenibacillus sp. J31TS4]GIP40797.1 hypothetical protein J31TS4_40770 [Paenibacillus sp. J31TS4]
MAETLLFLINASTLLSLSYLAGKCRSFVEGREWVLVPLLSGLAAILLMLQPLPGIGPVPDLRFLPVVLTALRYGPSLSLLSTLLPFSFSLLVQETGWAWHSFDGLLLPSVLASLLHRRACRDGCTGIPVRAGWRAAALSTGAALLLQLILPRGGGLEEAGAALLLFAVSAVSLTVLILLHNEENRSWVEQRRLEMKANQDTLTGLPNLRSFLDIATRSLAKERIAILMVDIDNFKQFNDRWGHVQGDQLLRQVGRRLQALIPEQDYIARYGGEEFILLSHGPEPGRLGCLAEELCAEVVRLSPSQPATGAPMDANTGPDVSISIGISIAEQPGASLLALIEQADEALYASKHSGKNRHTFHTKTAPAQTYSA